MRLQWLDALACRVPDMQSDDGTLIVDSFFIGANDFENLRNRLKYGRGTREGTYKRLTVDGVLWMSDTDAERIDHRMALGAAKMCAGGTGLVNGLGLGCVVGAWLDHLEHVDVVESDKRVIDTVGAWFIDTYGERITIYHGDAMEIDWPRGSAWSVVWHDIWPTINDENLPQMHTLHRRYGARCGWQGTWCRKEAEDMRRMFRLLEAERNQREEHTDDNHRTNGPAH